MHPLVDALVEHGVLHTSRLIEAFRAIDRADFVAPGYEREAYTDYPLPIGEGQTISQPTTVALMLEMLAPQVGERILDVGCGSGWTTALLAHTVGPEGSVIGVERIPALVAFGRKNLAAYDFPQAEIIEAGEALGNPATAPYDKILVSAAAQSDVPDELVAQLASPGVMVIPVASAVVRLLRDEHGVTTQERHEGFMFVPLIEA